MYGGIVWNWSRQRIVDDTKHMKGGDRRFIENKPPEDTIIDRRIFLWELV